MKYQNFSKNVDVNMSCVKKSFSRRYLFFSLDIYNKHSHLDKIILYKIFDLLKLLLYLLYIILVLTVIKTFSSIFDIPTLNNILLTFRETTGSA